MVRFLSKIKIGSHEECWNWTAGCFTNGYGAHGAQSKTKRAHRIAYEFFYEKEIPDNMIVMHLCDNPKCCNPMHLQLGTVYDNNMDKVKKNRQSRVPVMLGKKHTQQTLKKMSEAHKGEKNHQYGKKGELSTCYGRTGEKHPMYGRTHSEETRNKIKIALRKRKEAVDNDNKTK